MKKYAILGTLIIIVVWLLVDVLGLVHEVFLPSPIDVLKKLLSLFQSKHIFIDIYSTLWRSLGGFAIGATFGVTVGLVMGFNKKVYLTMEFPVDFFRSIPATALFPLFIVLFGLGNEVKLVITAWASSMVVLINTIYGIKNVSESMLLMAKLKKLSWINTFRKIIFPGSLSFIFGGLRIGLSLAIVVQVVAEMFLGSDDGLGYRVYSASTIFNMEEVYASIILIGLLGYLLNKSILLLERQVVHWTGK
jgi:ABC-type nitrate/sulfonate/bicarbonate transport system permease component